MAIKSLIPSSLERPKMESKRAPRSYQLQRMVSANFDLSTILLFGGLVQGTLLLLVPRIWVLLPTLIVLLARFGKTLAITFELIPNPQMRGVIHAPTTAVLRDTEGEFNKEGLAAKEKIAVLMLVARINHPLGMFAPQLSKLGEHNRAMLNALDNEAPNNGFLGQTEWTTKSEDGSHTMLLLSYWRSIEDILNFSVGPTHKATWAWWNSNADELKHIGISHEIFQADKNMYENVYINFQPTGLGATTYFRQGDELIGGTVPDTWVSPLVDASKGRFRTSKGRLGWKADEDRELKMETMGVHY